MGSSAYVKIKNAVDEGRLSLIHFVSPPRTASTPFFISLCEGTDGHACVPMGINFDDVWSVAKRCLRSAEAGKKVTIVVKDLANFIQPEQWSQWMDIVDHFVAIVRDPHLQMYSLIKCLATERLSLERELTFQDVMDHAKALDNDEQSFEYSAKAWTNLREYLANVADHFATDEGRDKKLVVAEGTLLAMRPERVMRQVCKELGIKYNERMVSDWQRAAGESLFTRKGLRISAVKSPWTGVAAKSKGFAPPKPVIITLDDFPSKLREHITTVALPIYMHFLCHPGMVIPRKFDDLEGVMCERLQDKGSLASVFGASFSEGFPVTSHALLNAFSMSKHGPRIEAGIRVLEVAISNNTPVVDHDEAYSILDTVMEREYRARSALSDDEVRRLAWKNRSRRFGNNDGEERGRA